MEFFFTNNCQRLRESAWFIKKRDVVLLNCPKEQLSNLTWVSNVGQTGNKIIKRQMLYCSLQCRRSILVELSRVICTI